MGEPNPGVVPGEAVTGGSSDDGDNGPSRPILPEVELVAGQDRDTRKANDEAEDLEPGQWNTKPPETDQGRAHGSGGIEQGGKAGLQLKAGPAEQGKGKGGAEETKNEQRSLAAAQGAKVVRSQEKGKEQKRGSADAGKSGGERAKFRDGESHEEEGGPPDGGEQQ